MRLMAILFLSLLLAGCATAEQQFQAEKAAYKEWLIGPYAALCRTMPGADSGRSCIRTIERLLREADGIRLSRDEFYDIELARYRRGEELRQLWTVAEHEAWSRGPWTAACNKAPLPAVVTNCLAEVQRDLDALSLRGHAPHEDSPEVRAERATARMEAKQRDQIRASQHEQELDIARTQAAGMILQGYALRGGPLGSFQQPAPYVPYQVPAFAPAPAPRSLPPVSCSTTAVGGYAQTNCY